MLSDENRETAIGHGVGGLLFWEWCGGRGLSVASSHLDGFQYSIITLAGVLFFLPERTSIGQSDWFHAKLSPSLLTLTCCFRCISNHR